MLILNILYDYPLAPDEIKIKMEILSKYQLRIDDFYNILIGDVKKLVPNFFDKEKHELHSEDLQLYLELNFKRSKTYLICSENYKL